MCLNKVLPTYPPTYLACMRSTNKLQNIAVVFSLLIFVLFWFFFLKNNICKKTYSGFFKLAVSFSFDLIV